MRRGFVLTIPDQMERTEPYRDSKIHINNAAPHCAAIHLTPPFTAARFIFLPTIFPAPPVLFFCEQRFQFGQPGWGPNFIETFCDLVTG